MCLLWKRRCCDLIGAFHNALDWREQEMIEYPTNSLMSFTSAAMTQAPSFKLVTPPPPSDLFLSISAPTE